MRNDPPLTVANGNKNKNSNKKIPDRILIKREKERWKGRKKETRDKDGNEIHLAVVPLDGFSTMSPNLEINYTEFVN